MYFGIVAVWFLISVPLTFVGGYLALRTPIAAWPVKTNQIPRHVPPPPLAANPALLFLAAGVLPFGTIFIELYFAMTSLWLGYFYYLFGEHRGQGRGHRGRVRVGGEGSHVQGRGTAIPKAQRDFGGVGNMDGA